MPSHPASDTAVRPRRSRLRRPSASISASLTIATEPRKPRRLFGRSNAPPAPTSPTPSVPHPVVLDDDPHDSSARRSFLAKPPAPGPARRVLTVLNQQQRSPKHLHPPPPPPPRPTFTRASPPHPVLPGAASPAAAASAVAAVAAAAAAAAAATAAGNPSAPAVMSPSGYQQDASLLVDRSVDHPCSDSEDDDVDDDSPSASAHSTFNATHDRRVPQVHEDLQETVNRFDSASSSMPSSRGTSRMIEVEASEISDDINSVEPKSRTHELASLSSARSPSDTPTNSNHLRDTFDFHDQDHMSPTLLSHVGDDETDIPDAPNSFKMQNAYMWTTLQQRIRALQGEVSSLRQDKVSLERRNDLLEHRNKDSDALMESLRVRASESNAEVEQLSRQMRDTRKRLSRRVRELEEHVNAINVQHSEQMAQKRDIERKLRHEIEALRRAGGRPSRAESTPTLPSRRHKSEAGTALACGPVTTSALPSSTDPEMVVSRETAAMSNSMRLRATSMNNEAASVGSGGRRRSTRGEASDSKLMTARPVTPKRGTHAKRSSTPARKLSASLASSSAKRLASSQSMVVVSATPVVPPSTAVPEHVTRTLARRSLIRRAFIAHIQSGKYRSARSAWFDFFGANGGHVEAEQFARAVRSLAVAADAKDKDLEVLKEEMTGTENSEAGSVSWSMFSRFYQKTKNESL